MCVIIAIPAGVKLPSAQELRCAFIANPDGAGFVTKSAHYKGMHFGTFYRHLKKRKLNEACIIHFRYATHGSKCVKNCHPFYKGGVWFAHNGVLPLPSVNDRTDSYLYFTDYVYPAMKEFGFASDTVRAELTLTARTYSSKFATMKNGEMHLYGDFQKRNGVYYSNLRHLWMMRRDYLPYISSPKF